MKEAKLPKIDPIQFIDVVNPTMLKQWFSNAEARTMWLNAADYYISNSNRSSRSKELEQLYKLPKNVNKYQDIDPIVLGGTIKEYVDVLLKDWKQDSDNTTARQLVASLPLFVEMSKYLPHVNPSEEYTKAFRGTEMGSDEIKRFVQRYRDESDWKTVSLSGRTFYTYVGSKKNAFTYTPHRIAQSWSVSDKAASQFGSEIVATNLDRSFFFDPDFLAQYGYEWESETIHFGNDPMKVALLIHKDDYDTARARGTFFSSDEDEDLNEGNLTETVEVKDEDGTLSIPL